jgi:ribosomal peptide maturation radical SAM protein 1
MIHLINMPFASIFHPALALGLIKSQLKEAGIKNHVFDLNLMFAGMIGFASYEAIAMFKGIRIQVSEWLFSKQAWEEDCGFSEEEFLSICKKELPDIPKVPDSVEWLKKVRSTAVPAFLQKAVNKLPAYGQPTVVGFSCSFFQTVSSLALGRLIKEAYPDVKLVFGGSCFHGEMGEELIQKVPWIDAVSIGEADDVIVPLFQALLDGRSPSNLQGILYRNENGDVKFDKSASPVSKEVLEVVPDADFDDYFGEINKIGLNIPAFRRGQYLPFEGSRGCWWGQKHHCKFCGLNPTGINYRAKTGERVYGTIANYMQKYPVNRLQATDNNLTSKHIKTLFFKLKESPFRDKLSIFFEVKVNLKREQVRAISEGGVRFVQPGIESLSTHLLDLLKKGTTALQNVYFLKLCREYNIYVIWNNLVRIPGEREEDYKEMENLIPKILHLAPPHTPKGTVLIECHRFSPYFSEKGKWLENVRPLSWYDALFPAAKIDLSRVAYYFEADWKDTLDESAYNAVTLACSKWNRIWGESRELPGLCIHEQKNGNISIEESGTGKNVIHRPDYDRSLVYRAIADPGDVKKVQLRIKKEFGKTLSTEKISLFLDEFVRSSLAIEEKGIYCGLAIPAEIVELSLEDRTKVYRARD